MQTYNLSEMLREVKIEVWDRVDLILKIFQKHAQTREAKLEIELAAVRHMGPRIYGMGIQLTRQGGGIGTRGAGETNLEAMKRHLSKHEDKIKEELMDCQRVRKLHREGRRRKNLKTIGIIGYTNAGKSSLLNALTRKGAYAANELFATLDTRVGKLYFPASRQETLVSDTIGFIQDLPTTLIQSFRSTLEETIEADLLLHVIDANDPKFLEKIQVVHDILEQIHAGEKKMIYVFNKTDLDQQAHAHAFLQKKYRSLRQKFSTYHPVFLSTLTGEGVDNLKQILEESLVGKPVS